jgi:hypothetical protein
MLPKIRNDVPQPKGREPENGFVRAWLEKRIH